MATSILWPLYSGLNKISVSQSWPVGDQLNGFPLYVHKYDDNNNNNNNNNNNKKKKKKNNNNNNSIYWYLWDMAAGVAIPNPDIIGNILLP